MPFASRFFFNFSSFQFILFYCFFFFFFREVVYLAVFLFLRRTKIVEKKILSIFKRSLKAKDRDI